MKQTQQSNLNFHKIYSDLNSQQKIAVDTIEGPVMVIAGPGTGKTQVLTARIGNILLKTDTDPRNILALTFTDSAANNMKERLATIIGPAAFQVRICTFHKFCNDLILQYPEYFRISRDSTPLSELEKIQIIENIVSSLNLEHLRPINQPLHYVKDIIKAIADLKREGVSPDLFDQAVASEFTDLDQIKSITERRKQTKRQLKLNELGLVYRQYLAELIKLDRYDFEDMIALVASELSSESELLTEIQERFQYVLVDEYQDTNSAQNQVVQRLMSYWGQQANLFVVGDPHQAIYRFQGASLENVFSFVHNFPKAKIIELKQGYRCSSEIYHAVFELVKSGDDQRVVSTDAQLMSVLKGLNTRPLLASSTTDGTSKTENTINLLSTASEPSEHLWLAEKITQLIKTGIDPEQIAILTRTNQELLDLAAVLDKFQIKYELSAGGSALALPPIQQLISMINTIYDLRQGNPTDQMFEVMAYPWSGLQALAVMKLGRQAGLNKMSIMDYLATKPDGSRNTNANRYLLTPFELEPIYQFVDKLLVIGREDFTQTLPEWFTFLIKQLGFLNWILTKDNKIELLIGLNSVFSSIKTLAGTKPNARLADLVEFFALVQKHGLSISIEDLNVKENAISLSTVHKAKGREWQYVFIPGLVDGRWGNRRRFGSLSLPASLLQFSHPTKTDDNADERRLLYVGITRAKQEVWLSYPQTTTANNQSKDTVVSQFVSQLLDVATNDQAAKQPKFQIKKHAAEELLPNLETQLTTLLTHSNAQLAAPLDTHHWSSDEKAYLKHLVKNFSLSVSSLNKYLHDPQQFLFDVLLRVPRAKEAFMAYGTAFHAGLEKLYRLYVAEGKPPALALVQQVFDQALEKEVLIPEERQRRQSQGHQAFAQYYTHLPVQPPPALDFELGFGYRDHPTYLDDLHLTGRVDRVDWLDQTKKLVKVIDYKTGQHQSVRQILGLVGTADFSPRELALPESIRGVYKRQLLFYKLLAQLSPAFEPEVSLGEFEFVQPNEAGKIARHVFDLPQEEVEELKKLIREVMTEIRTLAFLN